MKASIFIALIAVFATLNVNAQDDKAKVKDKDVPQTVRSAFESQFVGANDADWKQHEGNYKAKFTLDGNKHVAEFNNSGELVSKSTKIEQDQLPSPVSDALNAGEYSNDRVDEVYTVEKDNQTHYMVKMKGDPEKKVVFDAQGNVVKEKEKDKDKTKS